MAHLDAKTMLYGDGFLHSVLAAKLLSQPPARYVRGYFWLGRVVFDSLVRRIVTLFGKKGGAGQVSFLRLEGKFIVPKCND